MRHEILAARDHAVSTTYPARQQIAASPDRYARLMPTYRGGAANALVAWDETLDPGPWEKTPPLRPARDHAIATMYPARQQITSSPARHARLMPTYRGGACNELIGWYRGGSSLNSVDVEGRIGFSSEGGGNPAAGGWAYW